MKRITNYTSYFKQRRQFKSWIVFYLIIILQGCFIFIVPSCQKAGTGGNVSLMVYPEHHSVPIHNCVGYPDTVFLKFNVSYMPGTKPADYDAYFVGTPRQEYVHCEGLKPGEYYVYVTGMDSSGPYRVIGGMPLKIKWSQRKEHLTMAVPVVE